MNKFQIVQIGSLVGLLLLSSCSTVHQQAAIDPVAQSLEENRADSLVYTTLGPALNTMNLQKNALSALDQYFAQVGNIDFVKLNTDELNVQLDHLYEEINQLNVTQQINVKRYMGRDLFFRATQLERVGELEKAERLYSMVIKHFSQDDEIIVHYSIVLLQIGRVEEAAKLLGNIYHQENDLDRKVKLGIIYSSLVEGLASEKETSKLYQELMDLAKNSTEVCSRYSQYWQKQQQFTKALAVLSLCMPQGAAEVELVGVYKAKLLIQLQKISQAQEVLETIYDKNYGHNYLSKNITAKNRMPSSDFFLMLAMLAEDSKNLKQARQYYNTYVQLGGEDTKLLSRYIDLLIEAKDYAASIPVLSKLVDQNPSNSNLKMRLALLLIETKKWDSALKILLEVDDQTQHRDANVSLYLYSVYKTMGQIDSGITYLKNIKKTDPNYPQVLSEMSEYYRQKWVVSNGSKLQKTAWEDFLTATKPPKDDPAYAEWALQQGVFDQQMGQLDNAISIMQTAATHPAYREYHQYYLASLYDESGQFDQAEKMIHELLDKNPNFAHGWNFLGYSMLERKEIDFDKSWEYINKAYKLLPNDAHIRDSLGWFYFKKGDLNNALKEFQVAYSLKNDDLTIAKHLTLTLLAMKQSNEAIKLVEDVSKLLPEQESIELKILLQQDSATEYNNSLNHRNPSSQLPSSQLSAK